METTLKALKPGQSGSVIKITCTEARLRRRLYDMGITPSAEITMKKAAPLGDPIEVRLRGYDLTIRKSEAESVVLEVLL